MALGRRPVNSALPNREQSVRLLDAQRLVLELIVEGSPLPDVLIALARVTEEQSSGQGVASIMLLGDDGRLRHGAAPSLPDDYNRAVSGLPIDPNFCTCYAAAARRETVVTIDIENDPAWSGYSQLPLELGLKAVWSMPIRDRKGRVLGTFGTYFHECRGPTEYEQQMVQVLCHTAAIAIEHTRIEEENRQLLAEAQHAAEELGKASLAKDEFLSLLSHELRTPITTILGNADVLFRRGYLFDAASRDQALADMRAEAFRLHRIIENLLILARIDKDRMLPNEPVMLGRLVQRLVTDHMRQQPNREVLCFGLDEKLVASCQPHTIELVVSNLLSNAEKYSPKDTPIEVHIARRDDLIELIILDRGIGFDDEEARNLFEPLYRSAHAATRAQGMGIGLTVCKRLIEANGGQIWAAQRPGGGSEFGFTLPRVAID
jgi:signal transduction histidine kinase